MNTLQTTRALPSLSRTGIEKSRANLRLLETATPAEDETYSKDDPNVLFIELKTTCRVILNYLHETMSDSHDDEAVRLMEKSLVDFEKRFRGFVSMSAQDQVAAILKLVEIKDKAVYRTCNLMVGRLSLDYVVEYDIPSLATAEVGELVKVFATLKLLTRTIKLREFTHDDAEDSTSLLKLQRTCHDQLLQLSGLKAEHEELTARYRALTQDVGRQQVRILFVTRAPFSTRIIGTSIMMHRQYSYIPGAQPGTTAPPTSYLQPACSVPQRWIDRN